ncbi:MAG: signal peptidase I [Anaerolineales bacterium]|nr:signal peptidase I [Anaerolineales bacterium]
MLSTFLTFLTNPPGSWLYYFGLLAALEAPAALAVHQWWNTRQPAYARLAVAAAALFGLRVAALLATLLIPPGTPEALAVLAPLDRAAGLLSVLALIWALAFPSLSVPADLSTLGIALAAVVGLSLTWNAWATRVMAGSTFYNGDRSETLWTVACLLLLGWGLWKLFQSRPPAWLPGAAALGLLLLAYAGHYLFPVAETSAAGVVRWAELFALPLGLAVVYTRARSGVLDRPGLGAALRPTRPPPPAWRQVVETLLFTLVIYGALELGTGRFRVDGPSMQPNLYTGQFVLADKLAFHLGQPQRGDVVVVRTPVSPGIEFIKRVIGLPGETVVVADGLVRVNGQALQEPYIAAPPDYNGQWALGPDEYLVLGDNRNDSSDSHVWGPVHRPAILGKALVIYWPLSDWKVLEHTRH